MSRILLICILISIIIHLSGGAGLYRWGYRQSMQNPKTDPQTRVIELVQILEKKDGKPILQPEVPPELLDPESRKKTNFLSARTQRVLKETVSRQTGLTQNRMGGIPGKTLPLVDMIQKGRRNQPTDRTLLSSPNSDDLVREKRDHGQSDEPVFRKGKNLMNLGQGVSTINESLPGIDVASITALNTDTYLYYSFYSRMVTQIRYHWERSIIQATETAAVTRRPLPDKDNWVTIAEIALDREGNYLTTTILKTSGFDLLDRAVGIAYKAGSPIRNPPQEMIGAEDGILRITMSFSVAWRPVYLSQKTRPDKSGL